MSTKSIKDMVEGEPVKQRIRRRIKESVKPGLKAQMVVMTHRGVPKDVQMSVLRLSEEHYAMLTAEMDKELGGDLEEAMDLKSVAKVLRFIDACITEAVDKVYSSGKGAAGVGYLNTVKGLLDTKHRFMAEVGILPVLRGKVEASRRRGRRTLEEIKADQEKVLERLKKTYEINVMSKEEAEA